MELDANYFFAWRKGRDIPPLITTAPAGVTPALSTAGTRVVFGESNTADSPQSGVEGSLTYWVCDNMALRGGGLWVFEEKNSGSISSDSSGVPSIGLPYYNTLSEAEGATTIALENAFSGSAKAMATNSIWGANAMIQWDCSNCYAYRIGFLAGYQHYTIMDDVKLEANSDFLLLENTAAVDNTFSAHNNFNGGALGVSFDNYCGCWELSFAGSAAFGEMSSTVKIEGTGVISPSTGQLIGFVQDSNRGTYCSSCFAVVPEFSARVCYHFNKCFCLNVGYKAVYWSSVYLAGDQIDRRINPLAASNYPEYLNKKTTFWLQGVTLGFHLVF